MPTDTVTTPTTVGTATVAMTTITSTIGTIGTIGTAPSNATDASTEPSLDTTTVLDGSGQLAITGSIILTILMALITLQGLLG